MNEKEIDELAPILKKLNEAAKELQSFWTRQFLASKRADAILEKGCLHMTAVKCCAIIKELPRWTFYPENKELGLEDRFGCEENGEYVEFRHIQEALEGKVVVDEAWLQEKLRNAIEDKEVMDSIRDFYKGCGLAKESHHQEILILTELLGDMP